MNKIITSIIDYVNNSLGYPIELDEKSNLMRDAGLDSIDIVDLAAFIEDTYEIKISESEYSIFKHDIENISEFVTSKTNESKNIS